MSTRTRILIVDDDDRVLFVLRDTLALVGDEYEVVTARNGPEALDRVKDGPFALVITDLRMPGMDGVTLSEAIREQQPDVTMIWMTAFGCHRVRAESERLMVYRCLDKPLKIGEIRAIAREALETARRSDRATPQSQ